MAQTVRIEPEAHSILTELARATHSTLTETLSQAIIAYRREVFLRGLADDYAALRADPGHWADERDERRDWDLTSADGLETE
jgi:hypothetical protein